MNLPSLFNRFALPNLATGEGLVGLTPSTSWTPEITFATPGDLSVTYTAQVASSMKIGNRVFIDCHIETASFTHTTASGNLRITGMPFPVKTLSNYVTTGCGVFQGITKASYTQFAVVAVTGEAYLRMQASGQGQPFAQVTAADLPTGGTVALRFGFSYETA